MIQAEIKTDTDVYILNLQEAKTKMDGYKIVLDTLASSMPFEGDELLALGDGADIKHIIVREVEGNNSGNSNDIVEPAKPTDPQELKDGVHGHRSVTKYLGYNLTVDFLEYKLQSMHYYTIAQINGKDPFEVLGFSHHCRLLEAVISRKNSVITPNDIFVVPPSSLGSADEYQAYLEDYVKETQPMPGPTGDVEKNAKAWTGWAEKGGAAGE